MNLKGALVKLRKLEQRDIPGILSWMRDENVNRFFRFDGNTVTQESVAEFVRQAQDETRHVHRAVVDENDTYLGTVSLKNIDREAKHAEYAISMCTRAHGTGAAQFATKQILCYAFEELGLNRVYLNVLSENVRANRFYQKFGFVYEGEFKQHLYIRGRLMDLKWYRMLRQEYQNQLQR